MSKKTSIAWCDSTLNFWEGCTKVSAGCQNCYAEARDKRFTGGLHWGKGAPRRKSKSAVGDALRLNAKPWVCDVCGAALIKEIHEIHYCNGVRCFVGENSVHRRRIFSLSLGDWLDDEVPIEWLAEMLDTICQCNQVEWILCTKRPENFEKRMDAVLDYGMHNEDWLEAWVDGKPPPNITLLASVENQVAADLRIPQLLAIPAARRGLSLEPLLGPVDLRGPFSGPQAWPLGMGIQWLIIGGESGSKARPCNVEWIRSLARQGKAAGAATFVKQLGSAPYTMDASKLPDGGLVGQWNIRDTKGGDKSEWPEDLQIQEFPK